MTVETDLGSKEEVISKWQIGTKSGQREARAAAGFGRLEIMDYIMGGGMIG